jgi:hypothetical protein
MGIFVVGSVILAGAYNGWTFGLPTRDRTAIVGTALVLDTLLFAAVAAFLALMAYLIASGRPDLEVEIAFWYSYPNRPVFKALRASDAPLSHPKVVEGKQAQGRVVVRNRSGYAARNPGVRVGLIGLGMLTTPEGWQATRSGNMVGVTEVQWDGGVDNMIHGKWMRGLPPLNFRDVEVVPGDSPHLEVTVVADGMDPKTVRLPVQMLGDEEYDAYSKDRAKDLGGLKSTSAAPTGRRHWTDAVRRGPLKRVH